jgi:phosphate:Na+ symporter
MNQSLALVNLAGLVALLLWGLHMVQSGIQRAFGPSLRRLLGIALGNRIKAFAVGLVVTAGLQSSTATALMVTSFTADGLVNPVPALAVMLGANVGTTLIVQALAFDVYRAAPILVLIGLLLFRRGRASRTRDLGRVGIGLGLMLFALRELMIVVTPPEDTPILHLLLDSITTDPLIAASLAAVLTWAAHSSVAVVLLVMSFAANGAIPLHAAFALVLGANLGTSINPLLEAPSGGDPAARRLPVGNILSRLLGCVAALFLVDQIGPFVARLEPDPARALADFHTAFNLLLALVFLPVLGPWARLLRRIVPARIEPVDPSRPLYLDEAARESPTVGLAGAAREALRMADVLEAMFRGAVDGLDGGDRRRITQTKQLDDVLDRLDGAITAYLTRMDPEAMDERESRRLAEILAFTKNLEHAGDIVEKNLMPLAAKRLKHGFTFSEEGGAEIRRMLERLEANVRMAAAVFMTEDIRAARRLVSEKEVFRDLESQATEAHFARIRGGRVETIETGALQLDVLRDLRRINAHIVTAAYPVLEERGELLPSRLRQQA